jgi:hypothetical protein
VVSQISASWMVEEQYLTNVINGHTILAVDKPLRDKHERFVELAESRVNKAIHTIRLIGNLSNKSNYAYSEMEARLIVKVLEDELRDLKGKFLGRSTSTGPEFRLERVVEKW